MFCLNFVPSEFLGLFVCLVWSLLRGFPEKSGDPQPNRIYFYQ